MSNLVPINQQNSLSIRSMDDLSRVSKMLADSGFFTDAKTAAQCGVKVLAGSDLGFPAFAAMTGIHIIQGKPAIGAGLMAAAIDRSNRWKYRVRELTNEVCRIEFFEGNESIGVSEFTAADAKAAGTQNMNKFPKNMLFARAISNGVKWYCPGLFLGAVYTPEELGASVDGNGDLISVEVLPSQQLIEGASEEISQPATETPITEPQRKRMWAIAQGAGWTKEGLQAYVFGEYGAASGKEITAKMYEPICEYIKDPEAATMWNTVAAQESVA